MINSLKFLTTRRVSRIKLNGFLKDPELFFAALHNSSSMCCATLQSWGRTDSDNAHMYTNMQILTRLSQESE